MIGAMYPVLAPAGSIRNLSRALSTVVPIAAESLSATPRHPRFPLCKPVTPLPSRHLRRSTPADQPQKPIQYPETRPGSVQ
jgi:hypothetical protein